MLLAVVFELALWAHQNAYRATILRAPKGNVGLAVRKTVVALINQNLGQSLAMCFVGGDRVAQRQWELHAHYGHTLRPWYLEGK